MNPERSETEKALIRRLHEVQAELDLIGVHVKLWWRPGGIEVEAKEYSDKLIARAELKKLGYLLCS